MKDVIIFGAVVAVCALIVAIPFLFWGTIVYVFAHFVGKFW